MLDVEMADPPFELSLDRTRATLIGVHAPGSPGEMTYMGSDTHIHALVMHRGEMISGHVETVALTAGSILMTPVLR
jgi:hypothetical protein